MLYNFREGWDIIAGYVTSKFQLILQTSTPQHHQSL